MARKKKKGGWYGDSKGHAKAAKGQKVKLSDRRFKPTNRSGHGELEVRELGKKQRKELEEEGETTVTVSGEKRTLRKGDTIGRDGKRYQVYERSDKKGKSLRKPTMDHKRSAGHKPSNLQKKPFEGD
ncbi:MAG: hypothetical protein ACOC8Y_05905 [Candidatus Natronoplasma sp.]